MLCLRSCLRYANAVRLEISSFGYKFWILRKSVFEGNSSWNISLALMTISQTTIQFVSSALFHDLKIMFFVTAEFRQSQTKHTRAIITATVKCENLAFYFFYPAHLKTNCQIFYGSSIAKNIFCA